MFSILTSAFNSTLRYVLQTSIMKFLVFGTLAFVVSGFISAIGYLLPTANPITNAFSAITPEMWYFFDVFSMHIGIPMMLAAYVTRFIIRRLPVIG